MTHGLENTITTFMGDFITLIKNLMKGYDQMSVELKVKAKSLASEAQFIRKEERSTLNAARVCDDKAGKDRLYFEYNNYRAHRVGEVRREARATHLARAFLKGTPYRKVEATARTAPPLEHAARMVVTYGKDLGGSKAEALRLLETWADVPLAKAA